MIPRWPIAIAVGVGHAAALALLLGPGVRGRSDDQVAKETEVATASLIIEEKHLPDKEPAPHKRDRRRWIDVSGVVAPASAPQLSRFQPVEAATFARRAGLAAGQIATVVLVVEVLTDGKGGAVQITRSSGDSQVDEAAIAYARLLRWIPGTEEHQAKAMRVSLPITLAWSA